MNSFAVIFGLGAKPGGLIQDLFSKNIEIVFFFVFVKMIHISGGPRAQGLLSEL